VYFVLAWLMLLNARTLGGFQMRCQTN